MPNTTPYSFNSWVCSSSERSVAKRSDHFQPNDQCYTSDLSSVNHVLELTCNFAFIGSLQFPALTFSVNSLFLRARGLCPAFVLYHPYRLHLEKKACSWCCCFLLAKYARDRSISLQAYEAQVCLRRTSLAWSPRPLWSHTLSFKQLALCSLPKYLHLKIDNMLLFCLLISGYSSPQWPSITRFCWLATYLKVL